MKRTNAGTKSEKAKKIVQKAWRFFRSNLCTFVWDPNMGPDGGVMADFSAGHFTTSDKKVAKQLEAMGYPEIGLNDTQPPNIIVRQPTRQLRPGQDVPVMSQGINENLAQHKMDGITEDIAQAPEVIQ